MTTQLFLAGFLGLGGPEMAVIFILLLLLFGAKKLPELARGMGKSLGEFKKAREEFEQEITKGSDDVRSSVDEASGKQQFPG
jgi:sec-independent protein translocase protein TatA